MAVSFERPNQMHGRYRQLSPQPILRKWEKDDGRKIYDGQQYANFIKSLSTGENVDSIPPARVKSSGKTKQASYQTQGAEVQRNKLKTPISNTASASNVIPKGIKTIDQIKKKNEEEHKKKMKAIEDFMWQCKQEERALKRIEGDIIKKERHLNKTMKDYENEVYQKQREQENMLKSLDAENEKIKQNFHLVDEKLTKEKANRNINMLQKEKENGNLSVNTLNALDFRYETLADAINLKRLEVNELMKEFQSKMKQKEEEEFQLKKEYAELALKIRLEAQKKRSQSAQERSSRNKVEDKDRVDENRRFEAFSDQLKNQNQRVRETETMKRRMSRDLSNVNTKMSVQEREDGRKLMDVKSKLLTNAQHQKEAQTRSDMILLERQAALADEKIMTVNARRKAIQDIITEQRRQRNNNNLSDWLERNHVVSHQLQKQKLKDNIGHFQKAVAKHNEVESTLYSDIRNLESDRRKQEQTVNSLRQQLNETQKQNKDLLQRTAMQCKEKENELEKKLQREMAHLSKSMNEREEKIQSLVRCREASKEDKHMLNEEQKMHNRLMRIEEKTNSLRVHDDHMSI